MCVCVLWLVVSDRMVPLCLRWSDDKAKGEVVLSSLYPGEKEETVAAFVCLLNCTSFVTCWIESSACMTWQYLTVTYQLMLISPTVVTTMWVFCAGRSRATFSSSHNVWSVNVLRQNIWSWHCKYKPGSRSVPDILNLMTIRRRSHQVWYQTRVAWVFYFVAL